MLRLFICKQSRQVGTQMETLEMIEEMLPRQLTVEEIDEAEKIILQRVQIVEFPDELKTVISQGTVVHKPVSLILG